MNIQQHFNSLQFNDLLYCFHCSGSIEINWENMGYKKCKNCEIAYIFNDDNKLNAVFFTDPYSVITSNTIKISFDKCDGMLQVVRFPISQANKIFSLFQNKSLKNYIFKKLPIWELLQ